MGVRASHTAEVVLEDCRVPADNMLGGEDKTAFYGAMKTLESSRPLVAAGAGGVARAAYEDTLDLSRKGKGVGGAVAQKKGVSFTLADMYTKSETARHPTCR